MDALVAARAQMGTSLAFHIVFAALGIGLPVLVSIVEWRWLRTGDETYKHLAKTWAKAMAVLFAVGAVSGTVLSFELGLLWPQFMGYAGAIIGLPFSAEGFAFFVEAIFIGIYLYGWDRLSPRMHWLTTIPIAVSGAVSALFVVCANAWMNTPAGFSVVNGKVTDVHPLVAMFNPAWKVEVLHTTLAAYVFSGFALASIYAFSWLRGNRAPHIVAGMRVGMLLAAIAIPLQIIGGDVIARFDAEHEPLKFASLEGQFQTQRWAPLRIGGIPDEAAQTTRYAVEIPGMLSILAYGNPNAEVRGITTWPASDRPPVDRVHFSFQTMVGTGFTLLALAAWWVFAVGRKRGASPNLWLARAVAVSGVLALLAMEAGWMVTEEGRQPWIAVGFLRVKDAVTTAPALDLAFYGFSLLYVILGATAWWLLWRIPRIREEKPQGRPVAA